MTVMEHLKTLDPARDLDATPPEHLLRQLLADPRPRPGRSPSRPVLRGALALGATAAVAVGVSVATGGGGGPDLAARAYAQTDPAGVVLHVVRSGSSRFSGGTDAPPDTTGSSESWTYGREVHAVLTERQGGKTFTYDQLLGDDDVVRNLIDGEEEQVDRSGEFAASLRRDPVADFRARYARGVLDDSGPTTFRGRPARRYVVDGALKIGPGPGSGGQEEYFVDAETGAPLGMVLTSPISKVRVEDGKPAPGAPNGTLTSTQVIERVERLPATPENLAKVRSR